MNVFVFLPGCLQMWWPRWSWSRGPQSRVSSRSRAVRSACAVPWWAPRGSSMAPKWGRKSTVMIMFSGKKKESFRTIWLHHVISPGQPLWGDPIWCMSEVAQYELDNGLCFLVGQQRRWAHILKTSTTHYELPACTGIQPSRMVQRCSSSCRALKTFFYAQIVKYIKMLWFCAWGCQATTGGFENLHCMNVVNKTY